MKRKPLRLIEFLIRLTTRENQTIRDPFMGSGTTAVAARRLQRHFIGFEMDPESYAAAAQRLETDSNARTEPKRRSCVLH